MSKPMRRRSHATLLGLSLGLLGCSGQPGVIIDIGSWPEGAVALQVRGALDGSPSGDTLSLPAGTTRFVVYIDEGKRGQLQLSLTALDENQCLRASADARIDVGGGLRRIGESQVALQPAHAPYCAAPRIDELTPSLGPTSGGTLLMIKGQNFLPEPQLYVDGVLATNIKLEMPGLLTATLPRRLGAFGAVPIELRNRDTQTATRNDLFSYYASTVSFSTMTTFGTNQNPHAVAVGDWNEDGKLDLAVSTGTTAVNILLGDGTGSFIPHKNIITDSNITSVVARDEYGI